MRGGTSSLYGYLAGHPQVRPALAKESHYFDYRAHWGPAWYRAFFPAPAVDGSVSITGEATPYYLYHPRVPKLVARVVPGAKLIVLLRNPVDRAFSHHSLSVRRGWETLTFEQALDAEVERLKGQRERLLADERYHSHAHRSHSYKDRGLYADQLDAWYAEFDREAILVLRSETLFGSPDETLRTVESFLGLEHEEGRSLERRNAGSGARMEGRTRATLEEFFRPHNARLCDLLGWRHAW